MKTERTEKRHEAGRETFMSLLKRLRMAAGLTQTALARKLKVDPSAVSFWESGTNLPSPALIPKLARILGVPRTQLIDALVPREVVAN